ncbi:MAG: haloacid dehalogenase-like hydrolase, partial [Acidimicrobiia bacterium]
MPVPLYTQTVIAFIWDFDRTLIPGSQQRPLFEEYEV